MNNTEIAIWSCGRVSSSRCPKKMIRPFSNTSLTDIFLKKLARLKKNIFFAGYEEIFEKKCIEYGVPFVKRTERSANIDEPAADIYSFLNDQPYDYFLQVNACMPFIKVETILDFLKKCNKSKKASFAVFKRTNYFTELNGAPINFNKDLTTINTKKTNPVFEFAHAFYFFKKEYFVKNGWYWDWNELEYIEIPYSVEFFDIDTEDEFAIAKTLWNSNSVVL